MSSRLSVKKGCNPNVLSDISYGDLGIAAPPMTQNLGSGRSSPLRGRTMKEFEHQIISLKKENFDLKLRIFYLEEKNIKIFGKEYSETMKIKAEEVDAQLKDSLEKVKTLERLQGEIEERDREIERQAESFSKLQRGYTEYRLVNDKEKGELRDELDNVTQIISKKDRDIEGLKGEIEEKDREIERQAESFSKLQRGYTEYRLVNDKEKGELRDELDNVTHNSSRKDRDIRDAADDAKRTVVKLQLQVEEMKQFIMDKDKLIYNLEGLIKSKEKELQSSEKLLNETENLHKEEKKGHEDYKARYTKLKIATSHMYNELLAKENEAEELAKKVENLEIDLRKVMQNLEIANHERQKANEKILEMEQKEEGLMRAHGKKEAELENFRKLLEQAQGSLCNSEEAVEALQGQLEKERMIWKNKLQLNEMPPMDGSPTNISDRPMSDVGDHYKQLAQLESENKRLQALVKATEQTAHCQTQKMKKFRQMLVDHGLLPASLLRSSSEQNLVGEIQVEDDGRNQARSTEKIGPMGPRGRSLSLTQNYKGSELMDTEKLKQEIQKLQEENDRYKNVQDQAEVKTVMKWLDRLDQFMTTFRGLGMNQSPPASPQISMATREAPQLQSGLKEARGAIMSLFSSLRDNEEPKSPDSGCSDNTPNSLPNNSFIGSSENRKTHCTKEDAFTDDSDPVSGEKPQKNSVRFLLANKDSSFQSDVSLLGSNPEIIVQDFSPDLSYHTPSKMDQTDGMYKTLSSSRLVDMAGFEDHDVSRTLHASISDITSLAKVDGEHHIETIKSIIQSFKMSDDKTSLSGDSYHQHMQELQRLRYQLERQLEHIEMLQEKLNQMTDITEEQLQEKDGVIGSLQKQLTHTNFLIKEKTTTISEIKSEMIQKTERAEIVEKEIKQLYSKINQLEIVHEDDRKLEHLLTNCQSQNEKLSIQLEEIGHELKSAHNDLDHERETVENLNKSIDSQTKQLSEKDSEIDRLHCQILKKDEDIDLQSKMCEEMEEKLVLKNEEMSRQAKEQKVKCDDYRKHIEKQNALVKELREKVCAFEKELFDARNRRVRHESAIKKYEERVKVDDWKKQKLKKNLEFVIEKYGGQRKLLMEVTTQLQDTSKTSSVLALGLEASEKMISKQDLESSQKEHYISTLLQTTRDLQIKLEQVLGQNENITKQITQMTKRPVEDSKDGQENIRRGRHQQPNDINVHVQTSVTVNDTNLETIHTKMSSANNTWPTSDSMCYDPQSDALSCSLPIRKKTLGGPALADITKGPRGFNSNAGLLKSSSDNSGLQLNGEEISASGFGVDTAASCHFSVPGPIYRQQMTDKCLLYHVNDPPRHLAQMTNFTIDSDLRSLFAIGMIDHFEKLKKETHECQTILKGMNARLTERLKTFTSGPATEMIKSIEYGTLKELGFSVDELRLCVDGQLSMIAGFWTSELPAPNERGEFVNQRLLDEIEKLQEQVSHLKMQCQSFSSGGLEENQICESLMSTLEVVTKARKNFEKKDSSF